MVAIWVSNFFIAMYEGALKLYLFSFCNSICRENIIILEGIDNKHLKYLYKEAKYSAIDLHFLHERWSNGREVIVLTVFGLQEDLQDIFDGLLPLR